MIPANHLNIYHDISTFHGRNTVTTIGIFDGVHAGHQLIFKRLIELGSQYHNETVIITLWPHPRMVLQPFEKLWLLSTLDEKIELMRQYPIDHLIILPFTAEFAQTTYEDFIRTYLYEKIGASHVVVGYNHHFGRNRQGSFESLLKSSSVYGFSAERMNPVVVNNTEVSSSAIRRSISIGNVVFANEALGYEYFVQGEVIRGSRMGRRLGYPTANIAINNPQKLMPRNGVYAVKVEWNGQLYKGMANIGVRPTIESQVHEQTLEVHIFNFTEEIYGERLKVYFVDRIRNEVKFASVYNLIKQLDEDKKEVLSRLNQKV